MPAEDAAAEEAAAIKLQAITRGQFAKATVRRMRSKWTKAKVIVTLGASLLKGIRIRRMSELPLALDKSKATLTVESEVRGRLPSSRMCRRSSIVSRQNLS